MFPDHIKVPGPDGEIWMERVEVCAVSVAVPRGADRRDVVRARADAAMQLAVFILDKAQMEKVDVNPTRTEVHWTLTVVVPPAGKGSYFEQQLRRERIAGFYEAVALAVAVLTKAGREVLAGEIKARAQRAVPVRAGIDTFKVPPDRAALQGMALALIASKAHDRSADLAGGSSFRWATTVAEIASTGTDEQIMRMLVENGA